MSTRTLAERKTAITNAGTAVNVTLQAVQPGELWSITDYSLFNESGESVTVIPGFLSMGTFIGFDQTYTVANGAAFGSYYVHKHLQDGEQFCMQVKGAALKGKVTMIVSGTVECGEYAEPA